MLCCKVPVVVTIVFCLPVQLLYLCLGPACAGVCVAKHPFFGPALVL